MTRHQPLSFATALRREIVSRISAGDSALFEILMRRHNQRIIAQSVRCGIGG